MPVLRRTSAFAQLTAVILVSLISVHTAAAGQLTASWVDNSRGLASFELERRTNGAATFTTVADLPAGVTSYVDRAIVEGVAYCYRVRAYNKSGDSPYSAETCGAATVSSYSVTIKKGGTGTGLVASSTGAIFCGSRCSATFSTGTLVTLIAHSDTNSGFEGWSGGCSGIAACTVTGNTTVSVTAKFTLGKGAAAPSGADSAWAWIPGLDADIAAPYRLVAAVTGPSLLRVVASSIVSRLVSPTSQLSPRRHYGCHAVTMWSRRSQGTSETSIAISSI